MLEDLDGLTKFVAVAESKGFRAAGSGFIWPGRQASRALVAFIDYLRDTKQR